MTGVDMALTELLSEFKETMKKLAVISLCKKYRYSLHRIWDENLGVVVFIGLNPSIADAEIDDPTIRRCVNYAKFWGYGGIIMTNLFAYRATDSDVMKGEAFPIGPDNDSHLMALAHPALFEKKIVVAAWGNNGSHLHRGEIVKRFLECDLYYLELTTLGLPKHPLYLKKNLKPILWKY